MSHSEIRSLSFLESELFFLRQEYPPGTVCWFYDANQQGSGQRGYIQEWDIFNSNTVGAIMTTGEMVPAIHMIFEQIASLPNRRKSEREIIARLPSSSS